MNKLAGVLVLCPCYGQMPLQTVHTLINLQAEGANILLTRAVADVTLSRCIIAGMAEKIIRDPKSDVDFVFWLDSDVWGNADSVRELGRMILEFEKESGRAPTLSGLYLSRHAPKQVAAHKLRDVDPLPVPRGGNDGALLMPALCGMGCMMQTAETFIKHVDESARCYWPDRAHTIPMVCESGTRAPQWLAKYLPLTGDPDALFWHGEDFDYCARELDRGRPVFVAPIMFGHTSSQELTPVGELTFPGFMPPKQTDSEPTGTTGNA